MSVPTYSTTVRGQWLYDGCTTIDQMVDRLVEEADALRTMRDAGVTLADVVEDDYAMLITTDPEVAANTGLQRDEEGEGQ